MARDTFIFYRDWLNALNEMPDNVQLEVYKSIAKYALDGNLSELSPLAKIAFSFVKPQIDRDMEKYNKVVERNRANGKLGGRKPKQTEETQENPVGYLETEETQTNPKNLDNDNEYDNVNDNDNKNENELNKDSLFGTSSEAPTKTDRVPYKEIVEKYNVKFAGILPKVTAITDKRKKAMNTCVNQFGIESIDKVFDNVLSSNFLTGNNDRGWKCDFDFIFTASKYVRILEGNYRNTNGNTNGGAQSEESVMYRNFISWVNENAPRVLKMKAKLDEQGYRSIKKECGYNEMKRKLIEMNNYENLLTEYADPVMTCINWR